MKLFSRSIFFAILSGAALSLAVPALYARDLIVYSGRSQALVQPLLDAFTEETGISVRTRFGGTAQLALALEQEGRRSRADVFWAQDVGALGSVQDLLAELPADLLAQIPEAMRHSAGQWVGTSGRARVLAYSSARLQKDDLPSSLAALADPAWRGRVGWAPTNGSFQSFVTAMRVLEGDEATLRWLRAVRANQPVSFPNNSSLLQGLAAGEIDLALTNHYYLYRALERDLNFPVGQVFLEAGSVGNLVNYAGVGRVATSRNTAAADAFIAFLLSEKAQRFFVETNFEYPVVPATPVLPGMLTEAELGPIRPEIDLDQLGDLEGTIRLLREADLL